MTINDKTKARFDVSRETERLLEEFSDELLRWSAKINLISKATRPDVWDRHIADSAQLAQFLPQKPAKWIDIGAGGGLPGLVLAIIALEAAPEVTFHLVERDQRKCAFLQHVSHGMQLKTTIHPMSIEQLPATQFDFISARAVAPLPKLFDLCARFVGDTTQIIFPKGRNADSELAAVASHWHMNVRHIPSQTDPLASILHISELERR